ncbi:MAG: SGNH/GDSL hydrolase N-terminal domain-containing protein, partial [Planctomyces sp.]
MLRPSRRGFLAASAAGLAARGSIIQASDDSSIEWHDVRDWGLEGRGFNDTEMYFDRLPARAKANVREAVWNLSRHSA